MCLFMWSARWSDLEKARSHRWHWKGLCPVCLRKWRVSSSERANFHPHPSQLQWYGFSPASTEKWDVITRCWVGKNTFLAWPCAILANVGLFNHVGFTLTGVSSEMCLQVGTFRVGFTTASEVAGVRGGAFPRPCASSSFGFGLQQLEGWWGRCEHHPLCTWLQAETFIVHAKGRMRSVVGHLHLGGLRVVRESRRCVILLWEVHGLAHLCLAVWGSLVIGTERGGHVAGCARWDGHPWLLKGHHARNVPLLLDFTAALGHHAQNGAIPVHGWLHLDVVLAGKMHWVDVKSPLNAGVACNAIVVGSLGTQQLCHEACAVRRRRGAVVICWVGWHRVSRRVHAVVNCAHIFRHAVWASCVGENKIQIQIITQILVVLFAVIVLSHLKHGTAGRDHFVHVSFPPLKRINRYN